MPIQDQVGVDGLYVSFATSGHGFKLAFAMSELLLAQISGEPVSSLLNSIEPALFNLGNKRIRATGVLA